LQELEGDHMLRNVFLILSAAVLVLSLAACGKKEETAKTSETATTPEKPKPLRGEMALIPAGEFVLGSNEDKEGSSYPQQKINLPAFWIDKYEATNTEFLDFAIKTGYSGEGAKEGKDWRQFFTPDKAHYPVVYITWNDAEAYCKSLGKRLPTEEEWEKAARGTDGRKYPWGDKWDASKSNTYEASLRNPAAVGQYDDVSPYGVHDMLGNVQEWTGSWFKGYKGTLYKDKDQFFGKRARVVRGISARMYGARANLWLRSAYVPQSLYDFGCRCAKDATPEDAAKAASQTK
jgi:formylglycine-generating enzyme required for sulfatase activity